LILDFWELLIKDDKGEEWKSYITKNITKEGKIFIDDLSSNKIFNITKVNSVIFMEIKGLTELNFGKHRKITKYNPKSFYISDNVNYEDYIPRNMWGI